MVATISARANSKSRSADHVPAFIARFSLPGILQANPKNMTTPILYVFSVPYRKFVGMWRRVHDPKCLLVNVFAESDTVLLIWITLTLPR